MPAEATLEAPTSQPAMSPALAAASKTEIHIGAVPASAEKQAPPKKGSAKEAMFKTMSDRFSKEEGAAPAAKATEKVVEKPEAAKSLENADEGGEKAASAEAPKTVTDPKKDKVSPWKLVEEHKAARAAAEAKILELEKRAIPEAKWKETQDTLTAREKRLSELEEEIRYVNYSKSEEFKNKYQQPYEKAWSRAMGELGELTIETADGNARPLNANDILELVNAPLGKAHELAVEKFGDLAGEVMAHRKEIRNLFDQQASALDEARKSGANREKELTEKNQREFGEVSGVIKETWSKANDEAKADEKYGRFFTPVDGDEQGNQRLAKGYELADRAFSENPLAPGLTAEQRQAIVKRHAAVRNRAAAFGRQVYMIQQRDTEIADLKKQLAEYKGSEPGAGGSKPAVTQAGKPTSMGRIHDALLKIGRQG